MNDSYSTSIQLIEESHLVGDVEGCVRVAGEKAYPQRGAVGSESGRRSLAHPADGSADFDAPRSRSFRSRKQRERMANARTTKCSLHIPP
jgi:hypothetical protein